MNSPTTLLLPAAFCCSWPAAWQTLCTVVGAGAFAQHSLLHAKHASSLQDPAAFCTALLQRGWGDGVRLPAQQQMDGRELESSRMEPSFLGHVPVGLFSPQNHLSSWAVSIQTQNAAAECEQQLLSLLHVLGCAAPEHRVAAHPGAFFLLLFLLLKGSVGSTVLV